MTTAARNNAKAPRTSEGMRLVAEALVEAINYDAGALRIVPAYARRLWEALQGAAEGRVYDMQVHAAAQAAHRSLTLDIDAGNVHGAARSDTKKAIRFVEHVLHTITA